MIRSRHELRFRAQELLAEPEPTHHVLLDLVCDGTDLGKVVATILELDVNRQTFTPDGRFWSAFAFEMATVFEDEVRQADGSWTVTPQPSLAATTRF